GRPESRWPSRPRRRRGRSCGDRKRRSSARRGRWCRPSRISVVAASGPPYDPIGRIRPASHCGPCPRGPWSSLPSIERLSHKDETASESVTPAGRTGGVWERLLGPASLGSGCREGGGGECAVDDLPGDVGKVAVVAPGVAPEEGEGFVDVDVGPFGEHPFGLFDDDPAVEGPFELFGEELLVVLEPVLEDAEGGDVGQGLGGAQVGLGDRAGSGAEQVEGPDDLVPEVQRDGVDGSEPDPEGFGGEGGPAAGRFKVRFGHCLAGAVAVGAGALV